MAKAKGVSRFNRIGAWAFAIGVILAVVLGLGFNGPYQENLLLVLFLLGVVVGILNVNVKEVMPFLTSGTVLALVSFLGLQVGIFQGLSVLVGSVLRGLLTLFVPATLVVALKTMFMLAKN